MFRCKDVIEETAALDCVLDTTDGATVGIWTVGSTPIDPQTNYDKECDCPTLKIAYQSGTGLACTFPVPPVADPEDPTKMFYTLEKKSNTCILTCDGHFIMELKCILKEGVDTPVWVDRSDDDATQTGCIACWDGGCS